MAKNYSNSNPNQKTTSNAETKAALEGFKFEVANELGVPLQKGYNGQLSSKDAGSIGGQMVKKMIQNEVDKYNGQSK